MGKTKWQYEVREFDDAFGLFETGVLSPVQDAYFGTIEELEADVKAMLAAIERFKEGK